jgi:hypothetical protein
MLLHYFLVAFVGGFANKAYDDLEDNPLLASFKTPVYMEMLKGIHYVLFTTLALHQPVFFILLYAINCFNSLADPRAWSCPYEYSLPYSLALLYLLVDYTNLTPLTLYDVLMILLFVSTNVLEPIVLTEEYSLIKLVVRVHWVCVLFCNTLLPLFSDGTKCLCAYYLGYFLCSSMVQYYSLFIAETNLKPIEKETYGKKKRKCRAKHNSVHKTVPRSSVGGILRDHASRHHGTCLHRTSL